MRRDFRFLAAGQAISQLGSRSFGVAYMLWVLAATGSMSRVGVVATVMLATYTAVQLPAGWLADRFDRRLVMLACDAASASAALAVAAGRFSLARLAVAGVMFAIGWGVRGTAESASLPDVVVPEALPRAVAVLEGRSYATGLAGQFLGGVLFAVSPQVAFLFDGLSYLVAFACTACVRTRLSAPTERMPALCALRDGVRAAVRNRFVRTTALLTAGFDLVVNCAGTAVLVLLRDADAAPSVTGLVLGAGMAGGLVGAALAPSLQRSLRAVLVAGPAATGAALLALLGARTPAAIAAAYAAVFLLRPAWEAALEPRWLLAVDPTLRGRVRSAVGFTTALPLAFAPLAAGAAVDAAGPRATVIVLALASLALAAAARSTPGGDMRYDRLELGAEPERRPTGVG